MQNKIELNMMIRLISWWRQNDKYEMISNRKQIESESDFRDIRLNLLESFFTMIFWGLMKIDMIYVQIRFNRRSKTYW